jgi:hypothetical protein
MRWLDASKLSVAADPDTDAYAWTTILQFAGRFQLTLYDAAYLELAQRRRLPLCLPFWQAPKKMPNMRAIYAAPPASVLSHAAQQAFAMSRTRRI